MDLLGNYGDSDDDDNSQGAPGASGSDLSDTDSEDSAAVRAREADERLRDYGDTSVATSREPVGASLLPSALTAFDQIDGPPTFLDPEASRPLATYGRHGLSDEALAALDGTGNGGQSGTARQAPGKDFDISRLAPPLKGQQKPSVDKREMPSSAVIEGKAKRYKVDEGPQMVPAAVISMMGGHVKEAHDADGSAKSKVPTHAMPVSDFLDKGLGSAQLPRKNADRKDKEKEKRMRGQSTHANWKSEAEMVLRQQYD